MSKLTITVIAGIAILSGALGVYLHRSADVKMRQNEETLRQQEAKVNALMAEQETLSNQVAEASGSPRTRSNELAQLRSQAQALQRQTNAMNAQIRNNRQARKTALTSTTPAHSPEYYAELRRMVGAAPFDLRDMGTAFVEFASEHHGQFPSSTEQVTQYLEKDNRTISGTNQVDILFSGSLKQLKGIPSSSVPVIRTRQSWLTPDGKQARVYGMADGTSQIVESDDNFQSWEAEHVVTAAPGR